MLRRIHGHWRTGTSTTLLAALTSCAFGLAGCDARPLADEAPVAGSESPIRSTAPDKSLIVEVEMKGLLATQITEERGPGNDRDETYLAISGQTPQGAPDMRLPLGKDNDDYYEFTNYTQRTDEPTDVWTNLDQRDVGYPRIWNGKLLVGQTAYFQVMVMEQDNKDLKRIREAAMYGCDLIPTSGLPTGGADGGTSSATGMDGGLSGRDAQVAGCKWLAGQIPDKTQDDVIGTFQVTVKNEDGELKVDTLPVTLPGIASTTRQSAFGAADITYKEAQLLDGKLVDVFLMNGANSNYRADVAVKVTPGITNPLRYIGNTNDECSNDWFYVNGIDGQVVVSKGGPQADLPIASQEISYYCGSSRETNPRCDGRTNHVKVWRDATGRGVHWSCFKEEPKFTPNLPNGLFKRSGDSTTYRVYDNGICSVVSPAQQVEFGVEAPRLVPAITTDHPSTGACAWPHCSDFVRDTSETDVDCGGGTCAACGLGRGCHVGSDCASGWCNPVANSCVADHCHDVRQDSDEDGIDCGGSCARACPVHTCAHGFHDCDGVCRRICE